MQLNVPFLRRHLKKRVQQGKEDPARLVERYGIATKARPKGPLVWIHAASIGEAVSSFKIIELLLCENRNIHVLVTTGTVTSAKLVAERLKERVIHQYVPLDVRSWIDNFMIHWHPDIAIWIESELWPNLLFAIKDYQIPAVMVNGTLSLKSTKRWLWLRSFLNGMLSVFKVRFVQTKSHAKRMSMFHPGPHIPIGNIKFCASPLPFNDQQLHSLSNDLAKRPVWLAASTHHGEEEKIIQAHREILKSFPDALCIILPRHPERSREIEKLCEKNSFQAHSVSAEILPETNFYIVDTLGETGLFYKLSPIAFVGGSLVPIGGHNLIEPAQLSCAIIHGPYMFKSSSITDIFSEYSASTVVQDAAELARVIVNLLKNPKLVQSKIDAAEKALASNSSVLEKVMEEIRANL